MASTSDFNSITTTIEGGRLSTSSEYSSTSSSFSDQEQYTKATGRCRKWKKMLKKVVKESRKNVFGSSKPLIFGYDAWHRTNERLPRTYTNTPPQKPLIRLSSDLAYARPRAQLRLDQPKDWILLMP
ncbi:hypothetical protein OSB04_007272 [Centaurea solstitialis]|uniref:Uncharacterized protein n=1 Tax=Centaurea solstitialis TaxID=347529 RepID=A0AA38WIF8_9ASTR|nr:hypothetical protein OSB04_007272 [Centaurea solstitialis]